MPDRTGETAALCLKLALGGVFLPFLAVDVARGFNLQNGDLVIIGYNNVGIHCMIGNFSEPVILPPYKAPSPRSVDADRQPASRPASKTSGCHQ